MIRLATLFLTFLISTIVSGNTNCTITTYDRIVKINKVLDDSIIKTSNCTQDIQSHFINFITNAEGKLRTSHVSKIFQNSHKTLVTIDPAIIKVHTLNSIIEKKFSLNKFTVSNTKAIFSQASLNLSDKQKLGFDCKNCKEPGEKNINISYGTKTLWATSTFYQERKAYFSKDAIHYRTPLLRQTDFKERVISDRGRNNYFTDIEHIHFYKLNKNLKQNAPLKSNDLIPKKLISYGQKVKVIFKSSKIQLNSTAIAKKNGRWGDYIELVNSKSKKKITGRVVNFNTVVVDI